MDTNRVCSRGGFSTTIETILNGTIARREKPTHFFYLLTTVTRLFSDSTDYNVTCSSDALYRCPV